MGVIKHFLILSFFSISQYAYTQSIAVDEGNLASECYHRSIDAGYGMSSFEDIQVCDRAIAEAALNRHDLQASFINRGVIYTSLGKFNNAASDYERALEIGSEIAEIFLNRGNLFFLEEQWDKAISDYARAEELGLPHTHVFLFNRGMARENMNMLEEAENDYLAALEIAPGWFPVLEKLDRIQSKRLEQIEFAN